MATVVEILELSGVPTLCASKATREEAYLKVGEVIAKALQVLPTPVTTLQFLENPVLFWGIYIFWDCLGPALPWHGVVGFLGCVRSLQWSVPRVDTGCLVRS